MMSEFPFNTAMRAKWGESEMWGGSDEAKCFGIVHLSSHKAG